MDTLTHYPTLRDYRLEIETDEFSILLIGSRGYRREDTKKARVYVGGEVEVDFEPAYAATRADAEIKGSQPQRGDFPETDALFDLLNKQVVKNERAVLVEAIAAVPELAELVGDTKFGFNVHAGCTCSCSPGFIASRHLSAQGAYSATLTLEVNITAIHITKKAVTA